MASAWGASWGAAWGDSWGIFAPTPVDAPPITNPVVAVSGGGHRQHLLPSGRFKTVPTDEELQEQQDTEDMTMIAAYILRTFL